MAINNCYYRLIFKITQEFTTIFVLAKVRANPRNKPYTKPSDYLKTSYFDLSICGGIFEKIQIWRSQEDKISFETDCRWQ